MKQVTHQPTQCHSQRNLKLFIHHQHHTAHITTGRANFNANSPAFFPTFAPGQLLLSETSQPASSTSNFEVRDISTCQKESHTFVCNVLFKSFFFQVFLIRMWKQSYPHVLFNWFYWLIICYLCYFKS